MIAVLKQSFIHPRTIRNNTAAALLTPSLPGFCLPDTKRASGVEKEESAVDLMKTLASGSNSSCHRHTAVFTPSKTRPPACLANLFNYFSFLYTTGRVDSQVQRSWLIKIIKTSGEGGVDNFTPGQQGGPWALDGAGQKKGRVSVGGGGLCGPKFSSPVRTRTPPVPLQLQCPVLKKINK